VIEHGVDTGDRLEHRESDANDQGGTYIRRQQRPRARLTPGNIANLSDLTVYVARGTDTPQHLARLVFAILANEPVRALVLQQDADQKDQRGNDGEAEHQPPILVRCKAVV